MEQLVSNQTKLVNEESRILRECRGRRLALLGRVFRSCFDDTPSYVESETNSDKFYYVKFVFESSENFWCSCPDYASNRSEKCKHIFAVQYAIHLGLVQSIDHKLPLTHKKVVTVSSSIDDDINKPKSTIAEQYTNLSIATLNELEKAEIEAEQYRTQRVQRWEDDTYDF